MPAIQLPAHGRGEPHTPFRTLVDLWANAVAAVPGQVAIEDATGVLTYHEVWSLAQALAVDLRRRGCAGRGVAILLPNGADFHLAYLGALRAGAIPAPINPVYPAPQVAALLGIARARVVLAPAPVDPALRDAVAALPDAELVAFDRAALVAAPHSSEELPLPCLDNPGVLLFSGGTTGISKGIVHSHAAMANAVRAMEYIWSTRATGEVWLPVAPMSHIYGFLMGVLNPVYGAGRIVVPPRFQPDLIVDMFGRHRVTVFGGGPAPIYAALLAATNFATTDLSALAVCPSGGAPTPVELIERWRRATGLTIHEGYGMTEMAPIAGSNEWIGLKPGSVGRPLPCNRVEIVDAETGTRVLPPGEAGEIRIAGPYAMTGYLDRPDETARTLRDGWIHTGDIGHLDADGFLFVTDRKKDMVVVKGFNVFPRVVEEVVLTHPLVHQAGMVGVKDDRSGERLVAFVAADPELTEAELRDYVAARVAAYMVPAEFRLMEELPMTPAAKLDRMRLRRLALEPA
ncbi:class I adenylate-forming enzyme family protein [Rhodovastum atsumiense]|uniref:Long-chain fatty acid--CoA ligase n=1 Tax=Rhodovastum atsumiense TaxID=504468 RepID=A0A5M6ILR5_9PROT|nr:AMP-binding protein [Rhodovastum atsumiense]KAA5609223.1 long-chain fatty acid--CoA ligase [Rhodovastum atsumiense]